MLRGKYFFRQNKFFSLRVDYIREELLCSGKQMEGLLCSRKQLEELLCPGKQMEDLL